MSVQCCPNISSTWLRSSRISSNSISQQLELQSDLVCGITFGSCYIRSILSLLVSFNWQRLFSNFHKHCRQTMGILTWRLDIIYQGLITHTLTTFYQLEPLKHVPRNHQLLQQNSSSPQPSHRGVVSEMMTGKTSWHIDHSQFTFKHSTSKTACSMRSSSQTQWQLMWGLDHRCLLAWWIDLTRSDNISEARRPQGTVDCHFNVW